MSYKLQWTKLHFAFDYQSVANLMITDAPLICAIDTETTGLNITNDVPFLIIISWKKKDTSEGVVCTLDFDKDKMKILYEQMLKCTYIIGHYLGYDLHMLNNGGAEFPFDSMREDQWLSDTKIMAKLLGHTDFKEKLSLKLLSAKLIDKSAQLEQTAIEQIVGSIKISNRAILNNALAQLTHYSVKWNASTIVKFIAKSKNIIQDLPADVYEIYSRWLREVGEGNYRDAYIKSPSNMLQYAFNDGIFTLELFMLYFEQVKDNTKEFKALLKQEFNLIKLYYGQEKIGFNVDVEYLQRSRHTVKAFIEKYQKRANEIAGKPVNVLSSLMLRNILTNTFNVPIEMLKVSKKGQEKYSVDAGVLRKIIDSGGAVGEFAQCASYVKKAQHVLSNYLAPILISTLVNKDGRYHPTSDQVGTVTGRISGTMQQMPSQPLFDENGDELFNSRKVILPSGNGWNTLIMQDFDQMEGRVQAHYTIIAGKPDVNLLNVFIPYKMLNKETGAIFSPINPIDIANIDTKDMTGNSIWCDKDTFEPWVSKDFHGMHVEAAFGIKADNPRFKELRSAAKTINFATNYGSSLQGLLANESLINFPESDIRKIYSAYNTNFVGVNNCKKWISGLCEREGKVYNIYGRQYKQLDTRKNGYKLNNYIVQGSCADMLKKCLIDIDKFLKSNNAKSRVLYTIHDELLWEMYEGEEVLIKYFLLIIKNAGAWCTVPLTCGTDYSTTNWYDKKEWKGGE